MRYGLTCVLMFIVFNVFAQSYKKHAPVIEDFNKDGVLDTLHVFYDGGSNFGGTDVTVVNGRNAEVYELSNHRCFCAMITLHLIPTVLNLPENQLFLSTIQEKLFPIIREAADPSLEWILKGKSSNRALSENPHFDLIVYPEIPWGTKEIMVPEDNYSILVEGDMIDTLSSEEVEFQEKNNLETKKGFLTYCGRCHRYNTSSPELVADNRIYQVFKTSHGVFVKKEKLQKWILVNEINLTGSVGKLRWDSIGEVVLIDKYLVIQFSGAPDYFDNIFVGNIETGVVGRLKYLYRRNTTDQTGMMVKNRLIKKGMIQYVNEEEESFSVNAKDVFKELDKLYRNIKD